MFKFKLTHQILLAIILPLLLEAVFLGIVITTLFELEGLFGARKSAFLTFSP